MRESRTYGSVRGARGNSRPYRVLIRQSSSTAAMHTPLPLWVRSDALGKWGHFGYYRDSDANSDLPAVAKYHCLLAVTRRLR
jgi:hypothetical protein